MMAKRIIMKISKTKRVAFLLFTAIILLVAAMLPSVASTSRIDYETPIPLGAAQYDYASTNPEQKLLNIDYNFRNSIDEEKYYAGAYFKSDEDGTRRLCILVTDMDIVPNGLKESDKVRFFEVKYSYAELTEFREIVWEQFGSEGVIEEFNAALVLYGLGTDIEQNKISLELDYEFDVSLIAECIPADSFICEFYDGCPNTGLANILVENGEHLYNSTFAASCSVGLPIYFDYSSSHRFICYLDAH